MKCLAIIFICGLSLVLSQNFVQDHSNENHSNEQNHHSQEQHSDENHHQHTSVSSEEMYKAYANDDVQATFHVTEQSLSCDPPNGMGFHNLLRKSSDMLPLKEIRKIVGDAVANDPEVRQLRDLIKSEDFHHLVREIRATPEMDKLGRFVCKKMRYDLKHYNQFVNKILGADLFSGEQSAGEPFMGRPGVGGLLEDIKEVMPWKQLKQQTEQLLREDKYLRDVKAQFRSREFTRLVQKVRQLPKYQELKRHLRSVGLNSKDVRSMIETSLGWKLGVEFEVMAHGFSI